MRAALNRAGRLLAAHWPAMLAWFLGGTLVHFLVLKLAAWVGARSAVGGILLLPVAALALLIAYVAMLLIQRGGMPQLQALSAAPESPSRRRTVFLDSVLAGILPFVAFYAAWGYIREDVVAYINDAHEWQFAWRIGAVVDGTDFDTAGTIDDLGYTPLTIAILVIAFAGRWAIKRYRSRISARARRPIDLIAVYLEALWIYLAAYLITDVLAAIGGWVQSRQAMVWLADFRSSLTGWLTPLSFLWDGVEWLLGEAGGIILLPLAWLTIAGVIFGQAITATAPKLRGSLAESARTRYATVPQRVRTRLGDLWNSLIGRFRPIGKALVLMWRAGPVLIAGYVLVFVVIEFGEQWLLVGASRAIGPHGLQDFWIPMSLGLVLLAGVLAEPVRMALIAATYDASLGALRERSGSAVDVEAEVGGDVAGDDRELDDVVTGVHARQQDDGGDLVGPAQI